MDQIRISEITIENAQRVNQLVSAEFGYSSTHSYFDDFPIWGSPQAIRLGGYSNNELVSHVGIHFKNIKTTKGLEPIALIGAVATRKSHRGRGYSSSLMREAVRRIDQAGCFWSFLWGSEHDFYSKFGYTLSGIQVRASAKTLFDSGDAPTSLLPLSGYTPRILEEFISRKAGLEFLSSDHEWLSRQVTVQWLRIDEPFGYIAYGRGLDLKGIIHEFGGSTESIRSLIHHVYLLNPETEVLGRPSDLTLLGFDESARVTEGLCLARPARSSMLWNQDFWISGLSAV